VGVKLRARSFAELPAAAAPAPSIIADLAAQLASGDGAEVTFKFAADDNAKRMQAHSFILVMRSAMMRPQLRGPLASAPPHILTVPDSIAPLIFERLLLSFLYTDALEFASHEEAQHLLHAADYYGVPRLRVMAESALQRGLAPENAASTLELAHHGGFTELRSAVLRFVAAHASAVMATPQWSELCAEQPELIAAVLHTVVHGEPPAVV
jgi:speckle-type POZ protein